MLFLADWRRQVAALYADVRALARADPRAAWVRWREVRDQLYRAHPQSPVPREQRQAFTPWYFPYDPALRVEVVLESAPAGDLPEPLPRSAGEALPFTRLGRAHCAFPDGKRRLSVFWLEGYAGGLFLPFRDRTNGHETYGGGRYLLDAAKSADLGGDPGRGTLLLDFNFAYQPSCAFDPRWACPLAPAENWLDIPVRGGERLA